MYCLFPFKEVSWLILVYHRYIGISVYVIQYYIFLRDYIVEKQTLGVI